MTTIEDNTIVEAARAPKANGVHEGAPKARAIKVTATQVGVGDAVSRRQEATKELELELETIRAREDVILTELGIGQLRSQDPRRIAGVLATTEAPKRRQRAARTPRKAAAKPKAKAHLTASSESDSAAEAAILSLLKNIGAPMSIAEIVETTSLPKADAVRHLQNLREEKRVKTTGKARGTRYSVK